MLAPRAIPAPFKEWNSRWGAPNGLVGPPVVRRFLRRPSVKWRFPRVAGPFGFQANNETRRFEYPWAFSSRPVGAGVRCLDIGGSLAGFQFVLAKSGAKVTNVDPGEAAGGRGWPVDQSSVGHLNRAFGTDVELVNATLQAAQLPSNSIDIAYSISTIEHIPLAELPSLMQEITRVLKPGGAFVATIDLFLNLEPFSTRESNHFGINVRPRSLIDWSGLTLAVGEPAELLGFDEFDPRAILGGLENYLLGSYPALAQCMVLEKPAD